MVISNEPISTSDGVTYEPWSDGYAVGFKATHPDGRVEYIYLNPSDVEPDETPTVWVYQGTTGVPHYGDTELGVFEIFIPKEELT